MIFGGLQKLTLLDFPGAVACTLFTRGCNFLCPFCHNAPLVNRPEEAASLTEAEVLSFLEKRRGVLEGVAITGGEPLLHPELPDFIRAVRALGFRVKLDTNGTFPARLSALIEEGLLDYVAMDVKNSKKKYARAAGVEVCLSDIEASIRLLLSGQVPYEFRTTVTAELHTVGDIRDIAEWIGGAEQYFLQNFSDSGNLVGGPHSPLDADTLGEMCNIAKNFVSICRSR